MPMRFAFPATLIALVGLVASSADAQRAECPGCDSARPAAAAGPTRDRALVEQLANLSAEIRRLRAELARTSSADSSSARALRATIESLVASQRHLEEAIREHRNVGRSREAQAVETRTNFVAVPLRPSIRPPGYVGLTTEARYTIRESAGGSVRQFVDYPVIVTVEPGSPAFRAGLVAGDTVIAVGPVDGRRLEQELGSMLRPGETLVFRVRRGDDERTVRVRVDPPRGGTYTVRGSGGAATGGTLRRVETERAAGMRAEQVTITGRPAPAMNAVVVPYGEGERGASAFVIVREAPALAGARLAPLQHDLAVKLGVEHGLLVMSVAPDTPGARAGLEAGDVIVGTAEGALTSLPQLYVTMANSSTKTLVLRIVRDGEQRNITLRW